MSRFDDLGPNSGLAEELYQRLEQRCRELAQRTRARAQPMESGAEAASPA